MIKNSKYLIIIPAYNEEENIAWVVEDLISNQSDCDYIVINDGSVDATSKICHERSYNIIDLPVNVGLTGAFVTGMKYAFKNGYEAVIQFDADGQHLSEYIPKLVNHHKKGIDLVIGSRFLNDKKPFTLRMIGSHLISLVIKITTGKRIKDPTSGMRLFDRKIIKEFITNQNMTPEPDTVSFLIKNNLKVTEVQVEMRERMAGESYLNFSRSIQYMLRMVISILVLQFFRKGKK